MELPYLKPDILQKAVAIITSMTGVSNHDEFKKIVTNDISLLIPFDEYLLLEQSPQLPLDSLLLNLNALDDSTIHVGSLDLFFINQLKLAKDQEKLVRLIPNYVNRKGTGESLISILRSNDQVIGLLIFSSVRQNLYNKQHIDLLQILSQTIGNALSNVIVHERVVYESLYHQTLLSFSKDITNIRNRADLYEVLMNKIKQFIPFDDAVIITISDEGQSYTHILTMSSDERKANPHYSEVVDVALPYQDSLIEDFYDMGDLFSWQCADFLKKYPNHPGLNLMHETDLNSSFNCLLRYGDDEVALLIFHFSKLDAFDPNQAPLYQGIADQLSLALDNIFTNERILLEKSQKEALLSMSSDITGVQNKRDLMNAIIKRMQPVFNFDDAVINLWSEDKESFTMIASDQSSGSPQLPEYEFFADGPQPISESGPYQEIVELTEPTFSDLDYWLEKYRDFPGMQIMKKMGLTEHLVLPLYNNKNRIGVLEFHSKEKDKLRNQNMELFRGAADQVAVAASNILANEKILKREKEKDALLKITESVTKLRNLPEFLKYVMDELKPFFNFHDVGFFLLSKDGKHHYDLAVIHPEISPSEANYLHNINSTENPFHKDSMVAYVMQCCENAHGVALLDIKDLTGQFPNYPQSGILTDLGYRDCLAANLIVGEHAIGMFCINKLEKDFFKEEQFPLFKSVTDQLAVAVSNILANEEILKKDKEKTTLLQITEQVTKIRDIPEFLTYVMEKLKPIFGFHDIGFFLLTKDEQYHYDLAVIYPKISPSEWNIHLATNNVLYIPHPNSSVEWMMEQVEKNDGVALLDFKEMFELFPDYEQFKGMDILEAGYRDCLTTNLKVGEHTFGMFCINQMEKDFFKKSQFPLFKSVADQLAVAISNILANEEIQAQNVEQALKIDITEALSEPIEVEDKILRLAKALQSQIPFDLIILCFDSNEVSESYYYCFQPLGMTEYRMLNQEQLGTMLRMQSDELKASQRELMSSEIGIYDTEDYTGISELHTFFDRVSINFGIQSFLSYNLEFPEKKKRFHIKAFSKKEKSYTSHQIQLLENITPTLQLSLDKLLADQEIISLSNQLKEEKIYLQEEVKTTYNFEEMVGESNEIREVFDKVREVAALNNTVLLLGETGTGKELIARAIHNNSPRKDRVLVKVNCAAIPSQIVESELFGHEKGAFTGALKQRIGKFELAHQGTIFLDEIGEMPLELQSKLLRVLQEREVERVGSNEIIKLDFRVIAATNRNLEEEIKKGNFRADLYYRLNTFPLNLPPLRTRGNDVLLLADYFARQSSVKLGINFKGFTEKTKERFSNYNWPGNVREMQSLIEQSIITQKGKVLEIHVNKPNISAFQSFEDQTPRSLLDIPKDGEFDMDFVKKQRDLLEKEYILAMLEKTKWRVSGKEGAARKLGIAPSTLESRMQKLGIKRN